jgi:hypothetical protein
MSKLFFHTNLFFLGLSTASLPATISTINEKTGVLYNSILVFIVLTIITWLTLFFVVFYKVEDEELKLELIAKLGFFNDIFPKIILTFVGFSFAFITFKLL